MAAPAPAGLAFEFRQLNEDTDEYSYSIAFPVILNDGVPDEAANAAVEAFVTGAITRLEAAAENLDAKATLTIQLAPELLNDTVYSLSGVSTEFLDAGAGTVSIRHGWIIDRTSGAEVAINELFIDGDLAVFATAAEAHLIADVLGSADALTNPDGLLPVAANFHASWLTAEGIGVGFFEGQVAAREAGSPSVFIPFAELETVLDKTGLLEPLQSDDSLPEA